MNSIPLSRGTQLLRRRPAPRTVLLLVLALLRAGAVPAQDISGGADLAKDITGGAVGVLKLPRVNRQHNARPKPTPTPQRTSDTTTRLMQAIARAPKSSPRGGAPKRPRPRPTPPKPPITAEELNDQGDDLFDERQFERAVE